MRLPTFPATLLALALLTQAASAASAWTLGPMVHFNWGAKARSVSFGMEASWWTPVNRIPNPLGLEEPMAGFDVGFDIDGDRLRLYGEAQYGFYVGASAGPYLEFDTDGPFGYGMQGSLWGVGILGADLRARYGTRGFFFSPGLMAKIGGCGSDCEDP